MKSFWDRIGLGWYVLGAGGAVALVMAITVMWTKTTSTVITPTQHILGVGSILTTVIAVAILRSQLRRIDGTTGSKPSEQLRKSC